MIDWHRVSELREEIGDEDFAEVAALFLEETDAAIAAFPTVSSTTAAAHLHALRGSALNLGFAGLAGLCQTAEVAATDGAQIDRTAIIDLYAASRAAFLAALDDPAPG